MTHNKRHRWLAIALFSTPLLIATPAQAENPDHVLQLLSTRACARCDLQGANLQGPISLEPTCAKLTCGAQTCNTPI